MVLLILSIFFCGFYGTNSKHLIIVGLDEYLHDSTGDLPDECADDSTTTGSASNSEGNDIGVQCCKSDGTAYRYGLPGGDPDEDGCLKAVNYDTALAACQFNGDTLCTAKQIRKGWALHGTPDRILGCSHNKRHIWSSTQCGSHLIIIGNQNNDAGAYKPEECADDMSSKGSNGGDAIGVQCCKNDGSALRENLPGGSTDDNGCLEAVDWLTAQAACRDAGSGYRLCTAGEVRANQGAEKGCNHDSRHVWTNTFCDYECGALNIDNVLLHCSDQFELVTNYMSSLQSQIDSIMNDISEIQVTLNPPDNGIADNISLEVDNRNIISQLISDINKDYLILSLLIINIMFGCIFGCYKMCGKGKNRYGKVRSFGDSELDTENQPLH